jgi:hypothetical protein
MKLPAGAAQRLAVPGIVAAALFAGGVFGLLIPPLLLLTAAGAPPAAATERQSAQDKLARATDEEREIRDRLVDYRKLLARGVIGDEQRLDWVERIGEIKTARKLFDVRYSIDAQRAVDYPGVAGGGDVEFLASSMKLDMSLLHEEDLFRCLVDRRGALGAHVVVRSCSLQRSTVPRPSAGSPRGCRRRATSISSPSATAR